jgi:hypothetical protein
MLEDKEYTNEDKIADFLGEAVDIDLSAFILAVQNYIDNVTGRNFVADEIATARLFDGDDEQVLTIDDCIEVTKLEVGNDGYGDSFTEILATGTDRYFTLPNNAIVKGFPIIQLALRERTFIQGIQNQKVTAKWGYSEYVPDDISWVATFLVSSIYKQGLNQNFGGIKSERIGEYSVSFGGEGQNNGQSDWEKAQVILNNYKKYEL